MSIIRSLLLGCLLAAAGCGGAERVYPVSGTVTFVGKPVESGYIMFDPADGAAGTVSAPIQDGKYELKTKAGKKKVSILAFRDRPGILGAGRMARECYIPQRYNSATTLTAEVMRAEENRIDFPLTAE